jgi:hypothetical protein
VRRVAVYERLRGLSRISRRALFALLAVIAFGAIAVAVPPWVTFVTGIPSSGIGVYPITRVPGQPVEITALVAGGPAERVGVRKGDRILKVNGEDVSALTTTEVTERLRGPSGTQVDVVVMRAQDELAFRMTRETYVNHGRGPATLGVSPLLQAAALLTVALVVSAALLALAAFLLVRRAAGPLVPLTALTFIYFASTVMTWPVLPGRPDWGWLAVSVFAIAAVLGMAVLYRFPDGRYVPRATAVALFLVVGLELARVAAFASGAAEPDPIRIAEIALIASGVLAQVYRYRRVSTTLQRQQTKWFILGAAILLGAEGIGLTPLLVPEARVAGTAEFYVYFLLSYGAIAVGIAGAAFAIAFGVLKYRLFDIDVVINRALVYGSVTAILAGAFAGLSAIAQHLLLVMTGGNSEAVNVLIAIAVTAAFVPLKNRVQRVVDRRLKVGPEPQAPLVDARAPV